MPRQSHTSATVEDRLKELGYSSGEIGTYLRWWRYGRGYEAHRELLDEIAELRTREGF